MDGQLDGLRRWLVPLGLAASFAANDGEELATRGYTTGVATSPTVVLPQLWCAARALRRAGVPRTARPLRAAALVGGWLALSHAVGAAVSAAGRRGA